jgi:GT2 family glycosyltransferase
VISRNQLAHARVLVEYFQRHHPARPFYLLIVDGVPENVTLGGHVQLLQLSDLPDELVDLACTWDVGDFCAAVKPSLLLLLLERFDEEQVILLDPRMLVFRPLDELCEALAAASMVLVPQILRPLPDPNKRPTDRDILINGAYSDGFLAVRRTEQATAFLRWWQKHLLIGEGIIDREGPVYYPKGMVTARKWLDLVPTLFSEARLLRHASYNVAWWNLHHRLITKDLGAFHVNGLPLATVCFDGFDPLHPEQLTTAAQNRESVVPATPLAELLSRYAVELLSRDYWNVHQLPSDHPYFPNGIFGHLLLRQLYMSLSDGERGLVRESSRGKAGRRFVDWATSGEGGGLSPFLQFVYRRRPDLGAAFPDVEGQDRASFLEWIKNHGARELGFHPALALGNPIESPEPCSDITPHQAARDSREALEALSKATATPVAPLRLPGVPLFSPAELTAFQPPPPRCSIIIPVHGKAALTAQCLDRLLAPPWEKAPYEIIVVDDASPDATARVLAEYGDRIRVVTHGANLGFARTCNDGAAVAAGQYLVFLNNDTIPQPGWLDALVQYHQSHPRVGAVGSKLLYPNGTVQHAGTVILQDRWPRHVYVGFPADHPAVNKSRRFQAVTAASMLMPRRLFETLGGFDTQFVNSYEDVDLCLRLAEKGWEVHYCHESVLYHLESMTRIHRVEEDERNAQTYFRRWGHRIQPDDIQYYFEDGLFRIVRGDGGPRLSLSPYLAVARDPERGRRSNQLIVRRSRQLLDLLRENVELNVRIREAELGVAASDHRNGATEPPTGGKARHD